MMHSAVTVLIAEDDENDALMLSRILKKTRVEVIVHIVPDGAEAIAYLKGEDRYADRERYAFPRMLITDLKMPRKNGFELLEWLREHPECHLVPIMILSSSKADEDVIRAYQLGVNAFFQKPSSIEELTNLLELVLQFWLKAEVPPADSASRCC